MFPSGRNKEIKTSLKNNELDDIIETPKNISLNEKDTTKVQYGVENMTEDEMIIKK